MWHFERYAYGLLLFFLVGSLLFFSDSSSSSISLTGFAAYPGFGDPLFSLTNNQVSLTDTIVYKTGYYSVNGAAWVPFTLTGNAYNGNTNWLTTGAKTLPSFGNGEHYVILYSCSLVSGSWNCHGGWQLRVSSTLPSIAFESPTPVNGATVTAASQRILASITSSSSSTLSSFIDFDNSLLLWLRFENSAVDSSSSNYDTEDNGVTYEAGVFGNSATGFTESEEIYADADIDFASTNMTISFWLKVNDYTTPNRQNPFGKAYGGDGTVTLETDGLMTFYFGSSGDDAEPYDEVSSVAPVIPGTWEHWAITRNRNARTVQWYKNGVPTRPVRVYPSIYDPVHSAMHFQIGDDYTNPLNGNIDEVMIFKRVLSATEIKALYDAKTNKFDATITGLSNGEHDYTVYALDAIGNKGTSELRTFNVNAVNTVTWSSELMINGGFETGNLNGWTSSDAHWVAGSHPTNTQYALPQAGSFCAYYASASSVNYFMYQDVDISSYASSIDSSKAVVNASGWGVSSESTSGPDRTRIQILFLNSAKSVIATAVDTGYNFADGNWWKTSVANHPIPPNTRYIRMWGNTYEECVCNAGSLDSFSVKIGYGGTPPTCIAETNAAFCSRLGKECGSVTAADNCGTVRTVAICGTCSSGTCTNNVCTSSGTGTTYYLAPTGKDTNAGTIGSPWFTLSKVWPLLEPGDTVYMRGGIYKYSSTQYLEDKSGTVGNLIKIFAYPGETPIISPSTSFTDTIGLYIADSDYIHFKGLEITGFEQVTSSDWYNGVVAGGINNCIFELLNVHHNGFGFSVGNFGSGTSSGNLFLNSDFHHNSDPISDMGPNGLPWGGSDGLTIRVMDDPTTVNTIRGCRMWWNSDDGIDLFGNEGMIIIENTWAFWNGFQPGNFEDAGDGMGFKLGYTSVTGQPLKRKLTNSLAFQNKGWGIDGNEAICNMNVYSNTVYQNCYQSYTNWCGGINLFVSYGTVPYYIKNNLAYRNGDGNVAYSDDGLNAGIHTNIDHNSWELPVTITDADFVSLSSLGVDGSRQADGSLPNINFLRLASSSDLINKGVNVGLPYSGTAPDLGAFEYGGTTTCTTHASSACYTGDVYWYNSCGALEGIKTDCTSTQTCSNGVCVNDEVVCTSHNYWSCQNGDVYWYDSCDTLEDVVMCPSPSYCSNGVCVGGGSSCTNDCSSSGLKQCSGSSRYTTCGNYDSDTCLEWSTSVTSCPSGQTCSGAGVCATTPQPTTGALIIDHTTTDISQIPTCWLDRAKDLTVQYAHRSDGANVLQGLEYLNDHNSNLKSLVELEELPAQQNPKGIRIMDGNPPRSTYSYSFEFWEDSAIGDTADNWATGKYDYSMWSWCSEFYSDTVPDYVTEAYVGESMETYIQAYLDNMNDLESQYPDVRFIYMTSFTVDADAFRERNAIIRDYAIENDKILFDFYDLGIWDPDGVEHADAGRECTWCEDWCANNPTECEDLDQYSCSHSQDNSDANKYLCVQRAKAFWWMMARLAGWDGESTTC
jgi:hypothetical protein